jgi:hypothetical protein
MTGASVVAGVASATTGAAVAGAGVVACDQTAGEVESANTAAANGVRRNFFEVKRVRIRGVPTTLAKSGSTVDDNTNDSH